MGTRERKTSIYIIVCEMQHPPCATLASDHSQAYEDHDQAKRAMAASANTYLKSKDTIPERVPSDDLGWGSDRGGAAWAGLSDSPRLSRRGRSKHGDPGLEELGPETAFWEDERAQCVVLVGEGRYVGRYRVVSLELVGRKDGAVDRRFADEEGC